jgi:NAD(P)H-hydrate epimerase
MENAGKAIFEELTKIQGLYKKKIAVYCGKGNNGGDGFVCARYLHKAGYNVEIFITGDPRTPQARENLRLLKEITSVSPFEKSSFDSDIIVDALLGTGIKGAVREPVRSIIKKINASDAFKVSVDVPSGLNEEGKGLCVVADVVIALHKPKKGTERFDTVVKDIGIPMRAETHVGPGDLIVNIARRADSHKGDNGRVLIIGGSEEYHGAPILSALGALNSGADLVHLAVPECNLDITKSYAPDFIVKKIPGRYLGSKGPWYPEGKYDSIVIGPGLGSREETREAIIRIIKKIKAPFVLDADAISALAYAKLKVPGVITPHSKEFQVLAGKKLSKNNEKKKNILLEESSKIGSVILLKGPVDIVVAPDGRWKLNETGNEGMTGGGTGDVLAGVTGGLMAQGLDPFIAACCATFINGSAGDELLSWKGYCFTASDLAYEIPFAMKRILDFESD